MANWHLTYYSFDEYYDTLAEALEALPTDNTKANIYSDAYEGMSDINIPTGANVTMELSGDNFNCDDISVPEGATLELTLIYDAILSIENDITCDGVFTLNINYCEVSINNNVIVNESAVVNTNIGNGDARGDLYVFGNLSNYSSDFNIVVALDSYVTIDGATNEYGQITFDLQGSINFNKFYMYISNTYDFGDIDSNIKQLYVADGVTAIFKKSWDDRYIKEAYDMHGNELTPEKYQEGDYYITKYVVAQPPSLTATISYNSTDIATYEGTEIPITYGNETIATLTEAGTTELATEGKLMESSLIIGDVELDCQGKIMNSNVQVTVTNE